MTDRFAVLRAIQGVVNAQTDEATVQRLMADQPGRGTGGELQHLHQANMHAAIAQAFLQFRDMLIAQPIKQEKGKK